MGINLEIGVLLYFLHSLFVYSLAIHLNGTMNIYVCMRNIFFSSNFLVVNFRDELISSPANLS
jgi:hypothetical protein